MEFFPLDIDEIFEDNESVIRLFGKTTKGERVCVLDYKYEPYFLYKGNKEDIEDLMITKDEITYFVTKIEETKKKYTGKEEKYWKVFVNNSKAIKIISEELEESYEYDVEYCKKYLIDKNITLLRLCKIKGKEVKKVEYDCKVIEIDDIEESNADFDKPKSLAFDIETKDDVILLISFYGEKFKKVITWKKVKGKNIEVVDSEEELLERFVEIINEFKPDFLATYYGDHFDFPFIFSRAKKYRIDLDLNVDGSRIRLRRNKVKLVGIQHLDLYKFIKKNISVNLQTDVLDLGSVCKELIGEEKKEMDFDVVFKDVDKNIKKICEYGLHDSKITYELCKNLFVNLEELGKLTGLSLFDVCRSSYGNLVENYLIKRSREFNEIIPSKKGFKRKREKYEGAFVMEPKPGFYENMVVFDFLSLYPSIIVTHNIGLGSLGKGKKVPGLKHKFDVRKKDFIPLAIEDLINRRKRIKKIKKDNKVLDARSYALKTVANAMYGMFGFIGARWYCRDCGESITAYARDYIKNTIKEAEKEFEVIYGDSLPYDRDIFVKFKNGDIKLIKIGELYDKYRDVNDISTLTFYKGKTVFKPIVNVIRHKNKEKLLKIITRYGSTVVTPQHSVYSFNKKLNLVDAKTLKKGDKLISLTNPKIEETYKENHVFDLVDFNFEKYSNELVLYTDNLKFSRKNGKCPYCNKDVKNISEHVSVKHKERKQEFDKNSLFSWVGGKNNRSSKIPRYWTLDKDLAWLLGLYCAEGSVSDVQTRSGRKCILSFGGQNKKLIEKVKQILSKKVGFSTKIIKDYDSRIKKNTFYYRVQCASIVALFEHGFKVGKGSEFKKVPWFIFSSEESIRKSFIEGYLEGDGNSLKDKKYITHFRSCCTKSKELAEGLCFLFKTLNHGNTYWKKSIEHVAWKYRKDKPKIQSLRLQSAKEAKNNFCLAEIKSIKEVPNEKFVYDIEVKDAHNFVDAEGMLLVHNTDSLMVVLKENKKDNVFKFLDKINKKLPGLLELELEDFYKRGIFVSKKSGIGGAKKRYAMIDEKNKIKIRGFEAVRRNSSEIAKEVQRKVFDLILKENDFDKALKYVKKIIKEIKEGKVDIKKMVIKTQITRSLDEYTNVGPHVVVAKRMISKGVDVPPGTIVRYVVNKGKGLIREKAKLLEESKEYDEDYYINNQILPVVEGIFEVFGVDKESLIKEQRKLGDF